MRTRIGLGFSGLRLRSRRVFSVALVLAGALAFAGSAAAITPTITEYGTANGLSPGANPTGIAVGPDGNLWFTDQGTASIGRITPNGTITEFGIAAGSRPIGIVKGPDGNLWFTDEGTTSAIGRINPTTQHIDEYGTADGLNPGSVPVWITAGPDGNLWFTDQGSTKAIGRINPSTQHIDEFNGGGLPSGASPEFIASGPDGNLWFTDDSAAEAIGRITPNGTVSEFSTGQPSNAHSPLGITAGSDGNVWFTDNTSSGDIGRINPTTQAITEFSAGLNAGSEPNAIAAGPDGNLWFGDGGTTRAIGRIDPNTQAIGEFSVSGTPEDIVAGPDGNMWFTENSKDIGRITTPPAAVTSSATATGQTSATVAGTANGHAQATSFHVEYGPVGGPTTTTPEQSLGANTGDTPVSAMLSGLKAATSYQARVVVTNPTGTTAGAFLSFTTAPSSSSAPKLTNVRQSHRRWREGGALPHVASVRPPVGTRFRFTLNESALVRFVFKQRLPGRRVGARCVAPTTKNRNKPKCTHLVNRGALSFSVGAGPHGVRFQGRLSKHKRIPVGHYTLIITATNAAGQRATAKLTFTIVK